MLADYIRTLVLDSGGAHVLMYLDEDGMWDLPYFAFDLSHPENYLVCATKLQKRLHIDTPEPCFIVRTELLGRYGVLYRRNCSAEGVIGNSRLVYMEMQVEYIDLPARWEWKDVDFITSLEAPKGYDEGFQKAMIRTAQLLNRDSALMNQLSQPRHQAGWYARAASWLRRVVEEQGAEATGAVSQIRVTYWSTILCVNSTMGKFFLKAPTVATEMDITLSIQQLMPKRTLEVVGVSEPLKSFVSKEFEDVYGRKEEEHTLHLAMVQTLASMQLASLQHKEALLAAGCPLLGPHELIQEIEDWVTDEKLQDDITGVVRELRDILPRMEKYLLRLHDCKIPLTLTHGDFSRRNVGFRKEENGEERMVLFDWQNTAISHPFLDFYEFERSLAEEERDAVLDAYLEQWTMFEPLERCRELFEIARPLGWLLRIRGNVSCFRTANPVSSSETAMEIGDGMDMFLTFVERIRIDP